MDAQTCYDHMAHSIASIASQCLQVDPWAVVAMLFMIQGMQFYLCTAFGHSTSYFGGHHALPLQGGYQGNKASPALWLIISICLVNLMHQLVLLSQIKAEMTATAMGFAGFLFVDDTDLITFSDSEAESSTVIMEHMQHAILAWQGSLQAMGGVIQPEKCSWSLADFVWEHGKWRYATAVDSPGDLFLSDSMGMMQTLTCLEPSESVKVMGVHQALDGNMTAQFEVL